MTDWDWRIAPAPRHDEKAHAFNLATEADALAAICGHAADRAALIEITENRRRPWCLDCLIAVGETIPEGQEWTS